jgi:hypothetical protein
MVLWPSRDLLQLNTELPVKTSRRLSYSISMDEGKIIGEYKALNVELKNGKPNKVEVHLFNEATLSKTAVCQNLERLN